MRKTLIFTFLIFLVLAGVASATNEGPGQFDPNNDPALAHQQQLANAQGQLAAAQAELNAALAAKAQADAELGRIQFQLGHEQKILAELQTLVDHYNADVSLWRQQNADPGILQSAKDNYENSLARYNQLLENPIIVFHGEADPTGATAPTIVPAYWGPNPDFQNLMSQIMVAQKTVADNYGTLSSVPLQ